MTEKASLFQAVQIGIETTPGTPVPATLRLAATSFVPHVKIEAETFRPAGVNYPTLTVVNKEWAEIAVEGVPTYNELAYLLAAMFGVPSPVQQGTTPAYKWTFVPGSVSADTPISLTVEHGDSITAWRSAGVRLSELEIDFSEGEISLSGKGIGSPIETGITLTPNPATLSPKPIVRSHVRLKMADSLTGLNTAQNECRAFAFKWSVSDKIGMAFPFCAPFVVQTEPKAECTLKIAANAQGMSLIQNARTGTTKWLRLTATGQVIESPYTYALEMTMPLQVTDVGEFGDSDGVYMVEYTFSPVYDAGWGKTMEISLVNTMTGL